MSIYYVQQKTVELERKQDTASRIDIASQVSRENRPNETIDCTAIKVRILPELQDFDVYMFAEILHRLPTRSFSASNETMQTPFKAFDDLMLPIEEQSIIGQSLYVSGIVSYAEAH